MGTAPPPPPCVTSLTHVLAGKALIITSVCVFLWEPGRGHRLGPHPLDLRIQRGLGGSKGAGATRWG